MRKELEKKDGKEIFKEVISEDRKMNEEVNYVYQTSEELLRRLRDTTERGFQVLDSMKATAPGASEVLNSTKDFLCDLDAQLTERIYRIACRHEGMEEEEYFKIDL